MEFNHLDCQCPAQAPEGKSSPRDEEQLELMLPLPDTDQAD